MDGKQRLETIISFSENKIAIDKAFGDENLDGKKFTDLTTDYKRAFWDYLLVVDFIDDIGGTNIKEVFDRVNRNSKNLEPQELRHARFDGWFITEAEKESEEPFWWSTKVNTRAKDKRMKNIQFISELLLIILENKITGFGQEYLDEMYAKYDVLEEDMEGDFNEDEYVEMKTTIRSILSEMNAHNKVIENFGKTANNMYSLWAFVTLNLKELPAVNVLADKYLEFMKLVQLFTDASTPIDVVPTDQNLNAFKYYVNSKGAATEGPQRAVRYEALKEFIFSA